MERQTRRLELIAPPGLPEISPGDDLARLLVDGFAAAAHALQDGDIVVVAQKIVSKSEGRIFDLADVAPGAEAERLAAETGKDARLLELVLRESDGVVRTRPGLIIARHRLGFVVANAAVDHSNGGGGEVAILLPEDPDASAARLRAEISSIVGGDVAVVINDSMGRAWRNGTIGTAAGASGIVALDDRRGRADRDGVVLVSSEIAIADEIASAASLLMGQGDESLPAVLVRGATWAAGDGSASDLVRPLDQDLFR
jgi:coenzyme F420-0:L-glutamate ligase/coenzyme F420-1:gamma-L-glutamate ligase